MTSPIVTASISDGPTRSRGPAILGSTTAAHLPLRPLTPSPALVLVSGLSPPITTRQCIWKSPLLHRHDPRRSFHRPAMEVLAGQAPRPRRHVGAGIRHRPHP